jgi:monofunctional biosynthetic peptidoglycan transglycosylase
MSASRISQIARAGGRVVLGAAAIGFAVVTYGWFTLPDVRPLRTETPVTTAFMRLRYAEAVAAGKSPATVQHFVRYSRISPSLVRAVLVSEDAAFFEHDGIDYNELRASIEQNLKLWQFARGASTITQQLAKNLYLSPSRNPYRKVIEWFITRRLEAELSKTRILELYLNLIEWGDGIWGAEAAARRYFHKPAAALTASEAALLAGAIANPHLMSPAHPTARLRRRQEMIMRRMGAVTPPPVVAEPPPLVTPVEGLPSMPPVPDLGAPSALPGAEVPPPVAPKKPGGGGRQSA